MTRTTKKLFLTTIAALFLATGTAHPADIKTRYYPEPDNFWTIELTGEIEPGDETKFFNVVKKLPFDRPVTVVLNSPGGEVIAGLDIGGQIRKYQFATFVNHECASVCGLIWLAGVIRSFTEGDYLGFHAAYYADNKKVSPEANAMVGAYLNQLDFSYRTIQFLTSAPPDSMRWLTSKTAAQYNIEANIYPAPTQPKNPSTQSPWWMLAIVSGVLGGGFVAKQRQKIAAWFKPKKLTTFDKVLLSLTAVPVTLLFFAALTWSVK